MFSHNPSSNGYRDPSSDQIRFALQAVICTLEYQSIDSFVSIGRIKKTSGNEFRGKSIRATLSFATNLLCRCVDEARVFGQIKPPIANENGMRT